MWSLRAANGGELGQRRRHSPVCTQSQLDALEEIEDRIQLLDLEPHDAAREILVDIERLPARHGVGPDERVHRLDRLALDDVAEGRVVARLVRLPDGRVHDLQCLEVCPE